MNIAFIAIKDMPYGGGIEKFTEKAGSLLVERGHKVTVYCSNSPGAQTDNYNGMKIHRIPSIKTKNLQKLSLSFFSAIHLLLRENVDVVHFHSIGSFFSILPRIRKIKSVVHIHSLEWKKDKWSKVVRYFLRLSDHASLKFPNEMIVASETLKKYYENKTNRRINCISNGVNVKEKRTSQLIRKIGLDHGSYILYMGRLSREKGVHHLIKAYKELDTDIALVIAGDFADDKKYENLIRSMIPLNKKIHLLGFVDGALHQELFSNALIFVLPSDVEGSPISLLEAMSYGNCCLVSAIPENLEALGGHGYSFENGNAADLKRMLELLLSNKNLLNAHKKSAKEHIVMNYSWEKVVDKLESLYYSLLE